MSILKINLKTLYLDNHYLEECFPFEKYHEYLDKAILFELKRGNDFVEAASFAQLNNIEIKAALTFLISISSIKNNRIISLKYFYQCENENCGVYDLIEEEDLEEWTCYECERTTNVRSLIQNGLVNLNIAFEIDKHLRLAMLEGFNNPSSRKKIIIDKIEGGVQKKENFVNIEKYLNCDDLILPNENVLSKTLLARKMLKNF